MSQLKRIEIQDADNSDTYRALLVFADGSEAWYQASYGTIGEAARDRSESEPQTPIYNCTGRKAANKRNLISDWDIESGELG